MTARQSEFRQKLFSLETVLLLRIPRHRVDDAGEDEDDIDRAYGCQDQTCDAKVEETDFSKPRTFRDGRHNKIG